MSIKIAQLNIAPKNQNSRFDIFVAQPDAIKENLAGKIFILVEIKDKSSQALKILNFLTESINNLYYNNDKIFLREKMPSLKVEHIFESSLAKINESFENWLSEEKIACDLKNINVTAGLIYKNDIFITSRGSNQALLVYPKKKAPDKENEYTMANILGGPEPKTDKLFSDVISGDLPKGASLLICNETLPEYVSGKDIVDILSTLPPISAAEQIKQKIGELDSYVNFMGLIVKHTILSPALVLENTPANIASQPSSLSIINLAQTEDNTENLLSPPAIFNPKKWLAALSGSKPKGSGNIEIKDRIWMKKKPNLFGNIGLNLSGVKRLARYLPAAISLIFASLVELIKKLLGNFKLEKMPNILKRLFFGFSQLSFKNKILVIAAFAFLVLFTFNTAVRKQNNDNLAEQKNYTEISNLINQKQNQADASLLYSNEEGARKLYEEIKALLEELPQETEEQVRQHEEFAAKYEAFLEQTRRVSRIDSPSLVSDLDNLLADSRPNSLTLVPGQNKLYLGDAAKQSVYSVSLEDRLSTVITSTELELSRLEAPALLDSRILYEAGTGQIILFDAEKENFSAADISLPAGYAAADTFSGRLYALNTAQNQINRFNFSGGNFSSPYAWLTEETNLADAIDIGIDGFIYILYKDGQLRQFLRGSQTDLKLEALEPPLMSADKLLVEAEGERLFVLDKTEKRIVIFDKQGQFQFQLKYPSLDNILDFAVDAEKQKIYLLNANKVYESEIILPE